MRTIEQIEADIQLIDDLLKASGIPPALQHELDIYVHFLWENTRQIQDASAA